MMFPCAPTKYAFGAPKGYRLFLSPKTQKKKSMATKFVQQTVRRSLAGAAVGAGIGASVGVIYQFTSKGSARVRGTTEEDAGLNIESAQFPDLCAESDVIYLVEDMKEFRHDLPDAFDSMLSGLDKLCALYKVVHSAPKDEFKAAWAITAHHHAETIRDALRGLCIAVKDPAASAEIEERKNEIDGWISNTVHNISMQVQTRLQDGV